ncbi:hypothetical protein KDK82_1031 [Delftia sp. K82]|uniref:hypothetical protein n=1 Tax=Delftia sp. K82 TaxID=1472718 RepID=UPI000B63E2F3|nr:hypothetical protein [Delftia sp. K82]OWG17560.1 hypothetical protein KDK82_1031 [Delftia sp. K82]
MTLKEQFIKYFGEFKRVKNKEYFKTKEKHGLSLYYNYSKEEEHLPNEEKISSTLLIVENKKLSFLLNSFNEQMIKKYDYYINKEVLQKIQIICREIEIKNLEKQILEETKHLTTAKAKLQKF